MKDSLTYIISSIVDSPDELKIDEVMDNDTTQFNITVAKEDMGKIIGKNGKVIRAIRTILKIPALKQNKKIYISLTEQPQS